MLQARPRISQTEAQYIVSVLKENLVRFESQRNEHVKLQHELYELREQFRKGNTEVLKRLRVVSAEVGDLNYLECSRDFHVLTHKSLIAKYERIADPSRHEGRYSRKETVLLYPFESIGNLRLPAVVEPVTYPLMCRATGT
jgi:hypothetical protein